MPIMKVEKEENKTGYLLKFGSLFGLVVLPSIPADRALRRLFLLPAFLINLLGTHLSPGFSSSARSVRMRHERLESIHCSVQQDRLRRDPIESRRARKGVKSTTGARTMRSMQAQAGNRARTDDLLITNQLLYQLSYTGVYSRRVGKNARLPKLFIHPLYTPRRQNGALICING